MYVPTFILLQSLNENSRTFIQVDLKLSNLSFGGRTYAWLNPGIQVKGFIQRRSISSRGCYDACLNPDFSNIGLDPLESSSMLVGFLHGPHLPPASGSGAHFAWFNKFSGTPIRSDLSTPCRYSQASGRRSPFASTFAFFDNSTLERRSTDRRGPWSNIDKTSRTRLWKCNLTRIPSNPSLAETIPNLVESSPAWVPGPGRLTHVRTSDPVPMLRKMQELWSDHGDYRQSEPVSLQAV
ncbi:hypothetical protein C8F04DRAFT_1200837 [Mycena alexandri]|uniref:Uncharacterized protein n=1 Tax=Mycena alexandri TaxID=1745969 RepID=A0AAD6RXM5_9AGAR|nr:hypothetical protein C8F04DRAFT_1200837 [Mycena alexandri]